MAFYSQLGCKIGRFSEGFAIIDFFGSQVVCHYTDVVEKQKDIYPRHFGLVLTKTEYKYMSDFCDRLDIEKYKDDFTRYQDTPNEHSTFFIKDPSGNMIEFKTYADWRAV